MDNVKNLFKEFRSIFITEDILEENEIHANIVTATTMLNLSLISLITYILVYYNVFKLGLSTMNIVLGRSIIFLAIPSIICFILKGKGKWIKIFLFICLTIMLAIADSILKYNVTLIMALPLILSARYYNKKFTIGVAIITAITFCISAYMSVNLGQQDLNTYNLIIPEGTTIVVENTLRDSVTKINIDEYQRVKKIYIHFFLPKFLVYNIIAFACAQIAQSGKNMIKKQEEITKKGARIETELDLATNIQKYMLPSIFPPFPEHDEFDIYAQMTPAKEVGGDFYDMFLIDDSHLALVIADVSGKGIPASLFMMISKILIKNVTTVEKEIDKVLNRVNNMLCDGNETGIFVTAWLGILNLENGKLEFLNAGHNPPLVYRKKNNIFENLKTKPNMVLAAMENMKYQKHEIYLEPEDKIFLYTDGVVEATNTENKVYGEERLERFLNANADLSAKDTIIGIKKDIDNFVGNTEQFDDITMLEVCLKKLNPVKKEKNIVEKSFVAKKDELSSVLSFIKEGLERYNLGFKMLSQFKLVSEEIFINIVNYAYSKSNGKCKIQIDYADDSKVKIIFMDSGVPFNPLEKEEPDITLSAEDRDIGGLGIFITKQIMDKIEYKYEDGQNILTIIKNI